MFELSVSENVVGGQSDGIPAPQKMLFPGNKLTLKWERVYRVGAGLHNLGNTCFLNSTVQCLTYTPPLANYLLSKEHSRACEYLNQALKMQPDSGHVRSHSPIFFWTHLQSSHVVKSEISCLFFNLIKRQEMDIVKVLKHPIGKNAHVLGNCAFKWAVRNFLKVWCHNFCHPQPRLQKH